MAWGGCSSSHVAVPTGKEREHNFQPGDNVEVCEGELINLQGKVLSVDGNKITIMPKHEDLKVGAPRVLAGPGSKRRVKLWGPPACTWVAGLWCARFHLHP